MNVLKASKYFQRKGDALSKFIGRLTEKMNCENACFYLQLSQLFNVPSLHDASLKYIERNFELVVATENFSNLQAKRVVEILSSSHLIVTSEMEVFNAAFKWVNDRNCANEMEVFSAVRLKILTTSALDYILREKLSFSKHSSSYTMYKKEREKRSKILQNICAFRGINRYCSQEQFDIVFYGLENFKYNQRARIKPNIGLDFSNLIDIKTSDDTHREERFAVVVGKTVYLVGIAAKKPKPSLSVPQTNPVGEARTFVEVPLLKRHIHFCVCLYMAEIYVFGGISDDAAAGRKCSAYNPVTGQWSEKAFLKDARLLSACAVYRGRIVVSGGYDPRAIKKSVEAYDCHADEWSSMPDMIQGKCDHASVAVKTKLYVISADRGNECEVFDCSSNCFTRIAKYPKSHYTLDSIGCKTVVIGSRIIFFNRKSNSMISYDVESEAWLVVENCFEERTDDEINCFRVSQL